VFGSQTAGPGEEPEVQAIVVPNTDAFINGGLEKMGAVGDTRLESILRSEVKERCRNLAPYKRVIRLIVRYEEFEKTTTKKIKRYLYTGKASSLAAQLNR